MNANFDLPKNPFLRADKEFRIEDSKIDKTPTYEYKTPVTMHSENGASARDEGQTSLNYFQRTSFESLREVPFQQSTRLSDSLGGADEKISGTSRIRD